MAGDEAYRSRARSGVMAASGGCSGAVHSRTAYSAVKISVETISTTVKIAP